MKLIDEAETHWIIQNCTCTLIGFNIYEKTLELIEPIELTKGYPIDNLTVTQPLTPDASHPKKTIRNVINRLLLIAITHEQFDIYMNLASIISLVDTEGITDTEAPEDVFTECYLFDALVKIGLYIDCIPKLSINASNDFNLTFEPLDIKNKNNYTLDKLTLKEKQYPLSNYANQIGTGNRELLCYKRYYYSRWDYFIPCYRPAEEVVKEVTLKIAATKLAKNVSIFAISNYLVSATNKPLYEASANLGVFLQDLKGVNIISFKQLAQLTVVGSHWVEEYNDFVVDWGFTGVVKNEEYNGYNADKVKYFYANKEVVFVFKFMLVLYGIIEFIFLMFNPIISSIFSFIFNIIMILCSTTILYIKNKFSIHEYNIKLMYFTFGIYILLYFIFFNKILDYHMIHFSSVLFLVYIVETCTINTMIKK